MPQRIKKLSARAVVALKPEPSQPDTRDFAGGVSGLFLNIEQSGLAGGFVDTQFMGSLNHRRALTCTQDTVSPKRELAKYLMPQATDK